jgi:flagellar basal body-associated protein FliL
MSNFKKNIKSIFGWMKRNKFLTFIIIMALIIVVIITAGVIILVLYLIVANYQQKEAKIKIKEFEYYIRGKTCKEVLTKLKENEKYIKRFIEPSIESIKKKKLTQLVNRLESFLRFNVYALNREKYGDEMKKIQKLREELAKSIEKGKEKRGLRDKIDKLEKSFDIKKEKRDIDCEIEIFTELHKYYIYNYKSFKIFRTGKGKESMKIAIKFIDLILEDLKAIRSLL